MRSDGIVIVGSSPAMPARPPAPLSADDDADRAGVLGVLDLDREPAGAAVDERDRCPTTAAAFVNGEQRPSCTTGGVAVVEAQHHVAGDPVAGQRRPELAAAAPQSWAIDAGLLMTRIAGAGVASSTRRPCERCPATSVPAPLIRSTVSPQMSE